MEDRVVPSTSIPLSTTSWTPLGPASLGAGSQPNSGRITGITADPAIAADLFIATAGGGVWRTSNGGQSWLAATDSQPTQFMGAISIAPSNPSVLYAGTGEANLGPSKQIIGRDNIYYGQGVLKSVDAGVSWTLLGKSIFFRRTISKIAVDPTNANQIYVAVGATAYNGLDGNTGIWKSSDGGASFTNTTAAISTTVAWTDVTIDPSNPRILYAAAGTPFGDTANGIYKSLDGGASWSLQMGFPHGSTDVRVGRITLVVARTAPQTVYAAVTTTGQGGIGVGNLLTLAVTKDGGTSWNPQPTPNFMSGFGDYDVALAVDPNNSQTVFAAGQAGPFTLIRSTDGGLNWTDIGNVATGPHVDHHALSFDALGRLLDGNDGGIWRLDDPVNLRWTDLNSNLNTLQFVGIALNPANADIAYAGAQDNGTNQFNNTYNWNPVQGGDGGFVRVDPTNTSVVYHTFFYSGDGFLERSDNGGATWTGKTSGINTTDPAHFYPPYVLYPADPTHLLLGTNRVYLSTNRGDSWTPLTTPGAAGWTTSAPIDSVAASVDSRVLYAAAGGHIFVTTDSGATWNQRDPVFAPSAVLRWSDLLVDPTNVGIAYAVAASFNDLTGGGHVFRTTNGGVTWTNISGNLADLPAWSIALNSAGASGPGDVLYVGTDAAVYASSDLGNSWAYLASGLPAAQVSDLDWVQGLHILAAGTHGRGMWELSISTTPPPPPHITLLATGADAGGGPEVKVINAVNQAVTQDFFAYAVGFTGGVRVAMGDINGDGIPDVVTAPGPGGGPDIRVWDGATGALIREFFAAAPSFTGGMYVACGDTNGDGFADIVTGIGGGAAPQVLVFSGRDNTVLQGFFPYNTAFLGGVRVATGDVDGDGKADIITGAGPGGGPHVEVFSGATGATLASFFAYSRGFSGGVFVAAGDIDGDGRADIITGAGAGGGPHVEVFSGTTGGLIQSFFAYSIGFSGGVRVSAADVDGDGRADIITAPGQSGGPQVIVRNGLSLAVLDNFFAYAAAFTGGVFVGGGFPIIKQ